MPELGKFARAVQASKVVENRRRADRLAERGIAIIDFGAGEPDFDAPPVVAEAAIKALRDGRSHYVDPRGLSELRERIAAFEQEQHGWSPSADRVVVTSGSFCALSLITRALLNPGDEVLILEPYWGPYRNMVALCGAVPVSVPAAIREGGVALDVKTLQAHIGPKTRAVIVNTPNNPSGTLLDKAELAAIAELAERHDLWIIADEVYSELVFEGRHRSIAALSPAIAARTVIATSLSKTYALTGWRIGYCLAPPDVVEVLARINHYTVRCAASFVQYGAIAAFDEAGADVARMRRAYHQRRDLITARINRLPGFCFAAPQGTFYAFPAVPATHGDGDRFSTMLLDDLGIITTPGSSYGASTRQFVRFSFATSERQIEAGFDRIETWLSSSKGKSS